MSPASAYRRRLIALTLAACGLLLILFHARLAPQVTVRLLGPALLLYGLTGLAWPPAVHDFIKPEFGALQLWVESSRWPFFVGMAALALGAAIGLGWWLAG